MNSDVIDFASLAPAYPEMLLAVGAIVLLLVGVVINKERSLLVSYGAVLLLLVTGAIILFAPAEGVLHARDVLDTLGADAPEKLCPIAR